MYNNIKCKVNKKQLQYLENEETTYNFEVKEKPMKNGLNIGLIHCLNKGKKIIMKKYYFESFFKSLVYLFISFYIIGQIVLCFFADEIHAGVIFVLTILFSSLVVILFWFGFSLSMRIQIDYEKKELYIKHPRLLKKIKFEDIISIQIIDYNEVAFEFVIRTTNFSKQIPYARYLRRSPNEKIRSKLNELKKDFMDTSNKKY